MENLRVDLQMFADDQEAAEQTEPAQEESHPKTYTDEDVNKIIASKYAKWAADHEKAITAAKEEGAKLAKMNADQKKEYELEKAQQKTAELEKQIADLQAQQERAELGKSAAKILHDDYGIIATEEHLQFVVGKTAEETQANIKTFAAILQAERKAGETALATGTTPKSTGGAQPELSEIQKRINKYKGA